MIITIFLKRYYFGTIMNCKKSLFMASFMRISTMPLMEASMPN